MSADSYVIVKYDYVAQEDQELSIQKNERLGLLDDTKNWWKVNFRILIVFKGKNILFKNEFSCSFFRFEYFFKIY